MRARLRRPSWLLVTSLCLLWWATGPAHAADERAPNHQPVREVADQRLPVRTAAGAGVLALYASRAVDPGTVHADIERAVLVFHGRLRDAGVYWRSAQRALQTVPAAVPRTLLIVPQYLAERDVVAHALAPDTLRWSLEGWEGGDAAVGPAPISSFEAIDAVLALLADRTRFPHLAQVVLAGHSGGGQVVQRYAVVGQGEAALAAVGVPVRYVVANPSSYLYFSAERPRGDGTYVVPPALECPRVNAWKYGWDDAPAYAQRLSGEAYEDRYVARDVVYLLGEADVDPQHPALDRSCAGEGPYRLLRGRGYTQYLHQRHPQRPPVVHEIPGVGHDGDRMLGSACGRAALFDDARGAADCH